MEFDAAKNAANLARHGVSFEEIEFLDWRNAIVAVDDRKDYGEVRYIGYTLLGRRLHCVIWTEREGRKRPISFRKANKREVRDYEKEA